MQFIDEATIHVKAGDGGNGCVAFRREAFVPHGGPSGGDGGDGGCILVAADLQLSTLLDFKYQRHYRAMRGQDGRNKDQYGKHGTNLILKVPLGTQVYDHESGDLLGDLDASGEQLVVAEGGRGGLGNIHFAKPWNQAPRTATPGTPGDQKNLRLELKLLAECGLIGFPNVGKSTCISAISRAKPKIASYPFTTLVPHLGVVRLPGGRSMTLADIPGLIAGAASGAGLGLKFLRHVERARVLLHLLESSDWTGKERSPLRDFATLNAELAQHAPKLAKKRQIVALNKADLPETRKAYPELRQAFAHQGITLHLLSTASGEGMRELLEEIWHLVQKKAAE